MADSSRDFGGAGQVLLSSLLGALEMKGTAWLMWISKDQSFGPWLMVYRVSELCGTGSARCSGGSYFREYVGLRV